MAQMFRSVAEVPATFVMLLFELARPRVFEQQKETSLGGRPLSPPGVKKDAIMNERALEAASVAMANSIGVAMQNATTCQQNGQKISNASLAVVCAQIAKAVAN